MAPCTKPTSLRERKKAHPPGLIDAALRLFAERGFEATTVADIADAADVSPRTFFTHAGEDVLCRRQDDERLRDALATRAPDESFDAPRRAAWWISSPTRPSRPRRSGPTWQVITPTPPWALVPSRTGSLPSSGRRRNRRRPRRGSDRPLQPQVAAAAAVNARALGLHRLVPVRRQRPSNRPSTRRLTCWNTASAPSARPPAAIPAPRPPLRATPGQTTRWGNPARADMPPHQTTPAATLANDPAHHPHLPNSRHVWVHGIHHPSRRATHAAVIDSACSRRRHQPLQPRCRHHERTDRPGPARHNEKNWR